MPYRTVLRPHAGQLVIYRGMSTLIADATGQVEPAEGGYFHRDTRFLARCGFRLNGRPIEVFSAATAGQDRMLSYGRTVDGSHQLEDALYSEWDWGLDADSLRLRFRLHNYAPNTPRAFRLEFDLHADFADLQGIKGPEQVEQPSAPSVQWDGAEQHLQFVYRHGPVSASTSMRVRRSSHLLEWKEACLAASGELPPQGQASWEVEIRPHLGSANHALLEVAREPVAGPPAPRLRSSNESVNRAWATAVADLQSLPLTLAHGPRALGAGMPLYQHFFGRDTLTAGWQGLLAGPEYLRDALVLNARHQGQRVDDWYDEQPGKMIHQLREGPRSLLGEDALLHNYGDYAAPPDFVAMLGQYYAWTGDTQTTRQLLPAAWKALDGLGRYGDLDGDGFLEYVTRSEKGVKNQGWNDAPTSIVTDDGQIAENPLATSELQGYWYGALQMGAFLAARLQKDALLATRLARKAARLKQEFDRRFWLPEAGHYALALDAEKRPIHAAGSNDAHLLVTGIVPPERAASLVRRLFQPDIFTGWGIRTLSSEHPAYNPFSYHRGSVWPVEHGTFALGLARYGFWDELGVLAKAVFDTTDLFEENRLPEVVGGLPRDEDHPHPGIYPGSCSPQAWSASTILMLVQALLGLNPWVPVGTVFVDPHLPAWLDSLEVTGVRVGAQGELDIHARRTADGQTSVSLRRRRLRAAVLRQPPPGDRTATIGRRLWGLVPR